MTSQFLQIHTLTAYPAALLNRDDVGFAKRLPFGGAVRTRISSQCLKRHWRTFEGDHALSGLDVPLAIRSRLTFQKHVLEPLLEEGVDEATARAATEALMGSVLGVKKGKETKKDGEAAPLSTGQVTVLGRREVEFLLSETRKICAESADAAEATKATQARFDKKGDAKKNLEALRVGAGLDAALFGRMVTSDILSRTDAALHVAHAFTVHREESESDYFSAVDDLLKGGDDEQLGSGHIGTVELTSGLYYGYIVVDVAGLVSNLEGCVRSEWQTADLGLARQVVECLPHLVAKVSPGAKLGSTAPYAYAQLVLAEAGSAQPRTLANAFLEPVQARSNLLGSAYAALQSHLGELDGVYGRDTARQVVGLGPVGDLRSAVGAGDVTTLAALAEWAAAQVGKA